MLRSVHERFVAALLLVAAAPTAFASAWTGYWVHTWKNHSTGEWMDIGLLVITAADGELRVACVGPTYFGPDSRVPDKTVNAKAEGDALAWDAYFGLDEEGKELVIHMTVQRTGPDEARGPVFRGNREIAQHGLRRLARTKDVADHLARLLPQLDVELAVTRAKIPPMREHLKFWEKQMEEDRRAGRATSGTQTALSHTMARGLLSAEEARLSRLESASLSIREMIVRLEAAAASAEGARPNAEPPSSSNPPSPQKQK